MEQRLTDCEKNQIDHDQHVIDLEDSLNLVAGNLNEFYTVFMTQKPRSNSISSTDI